MPLQVPVHVIVAFSPGRRLFKVMMKKCLLIRTPKVRQYSNYSIFSEQSQ